MPYRSLKPGQRARIHVHDAVTGDDTVIYESADVLYEAPNWSSDGQALLVNGDGTLWSLAPEREAQPARIQYEGLPEINNDHMLDPDGPSVFMSAMDGHIYRGSLSGGPVQRVTADDGNWHFLHGVSPDGRHLSFVSMASFKEPGRLALQPAAGGATRIVDTGDGHIDGPEFSPDGSWLYFNTERWASEPGHAQLARVPVDGGEVERLVTSETVDWFPHLAPDGSTAVYIEFPSGTLGHPADREVALVIVATDDWESPRARLALPGGQGTINVNSWAPDSRRFAYVSYPIGS